MGCLGEGLPSCGVRETATLPARSQVLPCYTYQNKDLEHVSQVALGYRHRFPKLGGADADLADKLHHALPGGSLQLFSSLGGVVSHV